VAPLPYELPETENESIMGSSQRHETIYPTKECNVPEELNFGKAACVASNVATGIFFVGMYRNENGLHIPKPQHKSAHVARIPYSKIRF
jgi:hypothetical protein